MTKRKRNYAAEYKRRIERAAERGYSKTVGRGHAVDKGEVGPRAAKFLGTRVGTTYADLSRNAATLSERVALDSVYVFGRRVKRGRVQENGRTTERYARSAEEYRNFGRHMTAAPGDPELPFEFEARLGELKRRTGHYRWDDEAAFIRQVEGEGATEREAYTFWFSP